MYIVTKGRTHLRERPSVNSDSLEILGEGYNLVIIEVDGDWTKVETVHGKIGYVRSDTCYEG